MAIFPPENRLWWNEPVERMEIIWIFVGFVWGLIIFSSMIYWHIYGKQNLSNEAYRISPDRFQEKVEAMVDAYTIREEGPYDTPVVRPPVGSDVYLQASLWDWYPILELEKDKTYRLHLSSLDWQHGFSLQPTNINVQVHPGYDLVMTITPDQAGEYGIVCNEFCGIGHHDMVGRIHVVE